MNSIFKLSLIVLTCFLVYSSFSANEKSEKQYITVSVARGDTVWGVAGKYTGDRQDIREIVYEIQQINHLNKKC